VLRSVGRRPVERVGTGWRVGLPLTRGVPVGQPHPSDLPHRAVRPYALSVLRPQPDGYLSTPCLGQGEDAMNHPGIYLHWGVIQISLANLVVIGLMLAVFAIALFVPFPGRRK
jgi:hypothetical protein